MGVSLLPVLVAGLTVSCAGTSDPVKAPGDTDADVDTQTPDDSGAADSGGSDSGGSSPPPEPTHDVVLGTRQVCSRPVAVTRVDETREWGLDGSRPPTNRVADGGGLLAADLDGDGDIDLAQSFEGRSLMRRYLRDGVGFVVEDRWDTEALLLSGVDGAAPILAAGRRVSWMNGNLTRGDAIFDAEQGFVRDALVVEGAGIFVALAASSGVDAQRMDRLVGGPDLGARRKKL